MLFCLEYMRCFYQRSNNDGVTWSKPIEITETFEAFRKDYDWKVLATGPNHGIQLSNGRLIAPIGGCVRRSLHDGAERRSREPPLSPIGSPTVGLQPGGSVGR